MPTQTKTRTFHPTKFHPQHTRSTRDLAVSPISPRSLRTPTKGKKGIDGIEDDLDRIVHRIQTLERQNEHLRSIANARQEWLWWMTCSFIGTFVLLVILSTYTYDLYDSSFRHMYFEHEPVNMVDVESNE